MKSPFIFDKCPMCMCTIVSKKYPSINKDMSLDGFRYVRCGQCRSYYEDTVTKADLDFFYQSLKPYDSTSSKIEVAKDLARTLKMTGSETLLDLGSGSGAWSLPLLEFCHEITCVDLDGGSLDMLMQRVPIGDRSKVKISCSRSNLFLQNLPNSSFDILISMFSLEHDDDPAALVKEMFRVLRPNGRLVVLVPSADALQIQLCGSGFYWFQSPWHTVIPSKLGLRLIAEKAGFSNIKYFRPSCAFYSWFWIRGWADQMGLRAKYDYLRRYKWFIALDMTIDKIFDKISFFCGRPSYIFCIITHDT